MTAPPDQSTPDLLATVNRYTSTAVGVATVATAITPEEAESPAGRHAAPEPPFAPRPLQETVDMVRESCAVVADNPLVLAERFYTHLFEAAPDVRRMFPSDMTDQYTQLYGALMDILDNPDSPEKMTDIGKCLVGADRHALRSLQPGHYVTVGHALLRAIKSLTVYRAPWSTALSSAWVAVIEWISWRIQVQDR